MLSGQEVYVQKGNGVYENDLQPTATIIGKIVDSVTGTPLEFSTITLYTQKDSLVVTGGISDAKGQFSIETRQRYFFLKIEFLAYRPRTIDKIELSSGQNRLDLGAIELVPDIEMLGEVKVRAEKSSIVMSLDKRILNVGKDLASGGGTAEDILRNVPGVSFDIDGNISLRNGGSVRILLDGKPSLLIGGDNSNGLRQIQAQMIDFIEIITNPSARYEAEGMAGIINIVLKKNQNKGLNGSINASIGNPENYGLGVNINYHKNKTNWFAGIGGWYVSRPGTGSFRNQFYNLETLDSTIFSNMDRTHERRSSPSYFKFGADFHLNPKNILMTSFSYRRSQHNNSSELIYKDAYGSPDNIFLITQRQENETEKEDGLKYLLTYKKLFLRKGHHLTTDIRYENRTQKEDSVYDETYFDDKNTQMDTTDFNQLSNEKEGNRRIGIKLDYVQPVRKEGKFEGGFQSSFRTITNNYRVREMVNNIEIPDPYFTNSLNYKEVIHALYANFGNKINKFSFQLGLRVEYSDVETKLLVANEINPREYANLFPSTFLTYELPAENAIQLSYSRRIKRPGFADLNPFFTLIDRRNIFRGNPNIEPELTDSYELGHIKYWEKGSLSSTFYFRKTDAVIKRIQRVDENFPDRTITQAENLDFKRNFGLELIYSFSPNKWWRLNGDANFYHSRSEGTYQYAGKEVFVGGQSFSMTAKTSSRFNFWKIVNAQLTLNYIAQRTTTQGVNKSMIALDFASSIDILKNNGTVTFSISDLFNTRRRRSISKDPSFISEDNFLWQSRAILLSFNYRFNQVKKPSHIYSYPLDEDDDENF